MLVEGKLKCGEQILGPTVAPEVPATNFASEDVDEGSEEKEALLAVEISVFDVKLPHLVGSNNFVVLAGRAELGLLTLAFLELKSLLPAESINLLVVNNDVVVTPHVFRKGLGAALNAHENV